MRRLGWLLWLLVAAPLWAQEVVTNPKMVEFTPSPDHDATYEDGQEMVMVYIGRIWLEGAAEYMYEFGLGKPTPEEDGVIRIDLYDIYANNQDYLISWPVIPGTNYFLTVAARNVYHASENSEPSNLFDVTDSFECTVALGWSNWTASPAGESKTLKITTPADCNWSIIPQPWLRFDPSMYGTGTQTITVSTEPNHDGVERSGPSTVRVVAGSGNREKAFTVTQGFIPGGAEPPGAPTNVVVK